MYTFSVIIVSYNTKTALRACLDSLISEPVEILVVDNASTDGSADMVEGEYTERVRCFRNSDNIGFGRACNRAAVQAKGSILCFLNSDARMIPDFIQLVERTFESEQSLGILSSRLVDANDREEEYAFGRFPSLSRLLLRRLKCELADSAETARVDWVSGAVMCVRRNLFNTLGGFDAGFFMYYEDIDFCLRARRIGYGTAVLTGLRLRHDRGASLSDGRLRKHLYYTSQTYFFRKHYGILYAVLVRVLRFPLRLFNV